MRSGLSRLFTAVCFRSVLLSAIFRSVPVHVRVPARKRTEHGRQNSRNGHGYERRAVVGAKVTLVNEGTNATREAQTSANGEYLFLEVPVGSYEVDVNGNGLQEV